MMIHFSPSSLFKPEGGNAAETRELSCYVS